MGRRQVSYKEVADILLELPVAVRITRQARHLDFRQAAEESGVGFSSIRRLELGEHCSLGNAIKLLQWMDE